MIDPVAALVVAVVVAALIVAAISNPVRRAVSGWVSRDRKGRLTIALTPAKKKRKRTRKKR